MPSYTFDIPSATRRFVVGDRGRTIKSIAKESHASIYISTRRLAQMPPRKAFCRRGILYENVERNDRWSDEFKDHFDYDNGYDDYNSIDSQECYDHEEAGEGQVLLASSANQMVYRYACFEKSVEVKMHGSESSCQKAKERIMEIVNDCVALKCDIDPEKREFVFDALRGKPLDYAEVSIFVPYKSEALNEVIIEGRSLSARKAQADVISIIEAVEKEIFLDSVSIPRPIHHKLNHSQIELEESVLITIVRIPNAWENRSQPHAIPAIRDEIVVRGRRCGVIKAKRKLLDNASRFFCQRIDLRKINGGNLFHNKIVLVIMSVRFRFRLVNERYKTFTRYFSHECRLDNSAVVEALELYGENLKELLKAKAEYIRYLEDVKPEDVMVVNDIGSFLLQSRFRYAVVGRAEPLQIIIRYSFGSLILLDGSKEAFGPRSSRSFVDRLDDLKNILSIYREQSKNLKTSIMTVSFEYQNRFTGRHGTISNAFVGENQNYLAGIELHSDGVTYCADKLTINGFGKRVEILENRIEKALTDLQEGNVTTMKILIPQNGKSKSLWGLSREYKVRVKRSQPMTLQQDHSKGTNLQSDSVEWSISGPAFFVERAMKSLKSKISSRERLIPYDEDYSGRIWGLHWTNTKAIIDKFKFMNIRLSKDYRNLPRNTIEISGNPRYFAFVERSIVDLIERVKAEDFREVVTIPTKFYKTIEKVLNNCWENRLRYQVQLGIDYSIEEEGEYIKFTLHGRPNALEHTVRIVQRVAAMLMEPFEMPFFIEGMTKYKLRSLTENFRDDISCFLPSDVFDELLHEPVYSAEDNRVTLSGGKEMVVRFAGYLRDPKAENDEGPDKTIRRWAELSFSVYGLRNEMGSYGSGPRLSEIDDDFFVDSDEEEVKMQQKWKL